MNRERLRDRLGSAAGLYGWVTLGYLAGAVFSWQAFGDIVGPAFFPPAGITVAAMLLSPRTRWPVVIAAIVTAEMGLDLYYGTGPAFAAGYTLGNVVEPIVGASVVLAWCKGPPDLRDRGDLARFLAGACIVGPATGGLIGGGVSALREGTSWAPAALHWAAGDGVGVLVIGAPILLWSVQSHVLRARRVETVVMLLATAVLSATAFWLDIPPSLLLLPVIAWAAFRLDVIGAALAGSVLAFTANLLTDAGRGPFAEIDIAPAGQLAVTQAFIGVLMLVGMLIAQEASGRMAEIRQRRAEQLERARLQTLAQLAQVLSAALTPAQIGDAVESHLVNGAGANAIALGLVTPDRRRVSWLRMAGFPQQVTDQFGPGLSLGDASAAADAVRSGKPVVLRSPAEYQQRYPHTSDFMAATGAQSVVTWPLTSADTAIGVLALIWSERQPLDAAQLAYISAVATMVAQALVRARVYADEHARAAVLQDAVLPSSPADVPGLDVAVSYEPADVAQGLGGDWYDVLALPGGRTYVAVGDVVGHGLPAVEDMAQLRSAGRALALQGLDPARLLTELNRFTRHASLGKFATMSVAFVDPVGGSVSYGSAGHPPAFVRRSGGGEVISLTGANGPVLGPVAEAGYGYRETAIGPGDTLVMYTDGLVERRGQDIETGISRAQSLVAAWTSEDRLAEACSRLLHALAPAPRSDDVCVVALRLV